jgi:hypothetical protein
VDDDPGPDRAVVLLAQSASHQYPGVGGDRSQGRGNALQHAEQRQVVERVREPDQEKRGQRAQQALDGAGAPCPDGPSTPTATTAA